MENLIGSGTASSCAVSSIEDKTIIVIRVDPKSRIELIDVLSIKRNA